MTSISYKIIGGDGREYGPVSLEEIKAWIQDGRVAGATLVWSSESGSWTPASRLADLQPEIGQAVPWTPPSPGNAPSPEQTLATVGFGPRFVAYVVDWLLVNMLGIFLPENEAVRALSRGEMITPEQFGSVLVYLLIGVFITGVYHVGMNGSIGATVGKLMLGARVVRMDGSSLGYGRAALRFLAETLSWLTLGIGFLLIGFRSDRRALHDLLAGTQVVWRR